MNNQHEIDFYAAQVKTWDGEVTVARIQADCRVGYQKAVRIAQQLGITQPDDPVPTELVETFENNVSAELAIVEAAVTDVNPGIALGNLLKNFDLGPELTCCRPLPETTDLQIGEALRAVKNISSFSEWAWGDLINELEARGYENVVDQVASHFHMEAQTKWLYNCATVARRVPVEHRSQKLHFSHYAEIATRRYSADEKENQEKVIELIQSAEKEGWNTVQTRAEAKRAQGKEEKPTPPPPKKKLGRFIVVYFDDCWKSYSCDQLPDADDHHIVIDTESQLIACEGCSLGTPVWRPLPYETLEATATEPEVEEE
jgi:hypothetical protein